MSPRRTSASPRSTNRTKSQPASTPPLDRYELYTLCAQAPERDARLLRAIHAQASLDRPRGLILGEDFSAAAALSRAWCELDRTSRAVAVDHDPEALARAKKHPRVRLVRSDVMACRAPADVIAVLNFSIGELHARRALVKYFRHARSRIRPGGCLVCDIYGGSDAYLTGTVWQTIRTPGGLKIRYGWEQRSADPFTARVVDAMHFEVRHEGGRGSGGGGVQKLRDAYVYDWRLWSVPELCEAMHEAGWASTQVYARTADALDDNGDLYAMPLQDAHEVSDAFSVLVVARG